MNGCPKKLVLLVVLHSTAKFISRSYTLFCERRHGVARSGKAGEEIMYSIKPCLVAALMLASFTSPGSARSIWDQLNETAPLKTVFETLNETAPLKTVFDTLNETAP